MSEIPLGKPTAAPEAYDRTLLAPMERAPGRAAAGIGQPPPFTGEDVWNAYEFSWLDPRGRPRVAGLRLRVGADSQHIVESKSMKLYLGGFAQERFESAEAVAALVQEDLEAAFGGAVSVELLPLAGLLAPAELPGESLDELEVSCEVYEHDSALLALSGAPAAEESLRTDLFRSLCPVTGQPDWATILIRYRGPAIDREALLRYLVSFRRHQGFHETAVEQMFVDLKARCDCEQLMVAGFFLRRGGIDINPLRTDGDWPWPLARTERQ